MGAFKKIIIAVIAALAFLPEAKAQQDPQYSQYMFNQLALNPAYAGSKEALSTTVLLRNQWTGIEGAPKTETFSIHAPLKKKKVGLGFTVIADQIGPVKSIGALGSYAYRIPIGNGKLSFGLRAGIYNYTYNWSEITYKDQNDVYNTGNITSRIVPTADAGIYYYTNTLYAGLSATHLYNGRLTSVSNLNGDNAQLSPHLFFTFGKSWQFSDKLVFAPSLLVKGAKGAPTEIDLNACFLLKDRLWLGGSFRTGYGVVALVEFQITDKFKLGYSYDMGLNKIGVAGRGSHEIMIGYDFNIFKSRMMSPRYL
jgi:type IX secretion system PorP/SprF family membrane protein